jgi:hypothetical protein
VEALDRVGDIGAVQTQVNGHGNEDKHGNERKGRKNPK